MDRGAWWAAVYGVAQSRTRLARFGMHACIGEGNGNPLQYSCLENPVDRGAWWAAVYGVAQSRTWLKRLGMHACIGEGNGNPLQYSCLENPVDRGAWWAAVYRVSQSRTRLKRLSSSSSSCCAQLWLPLCGLPGSSDHGIFQARILEWVAISFSLCASGNVYKIALHY